MWTRSLIDGLLKYLTNRDSATLIVEVGVGSGIVPIVLNNQLAGDKWLEYIGLDINRVACEAAELNLQMNGESLRSNMLLQSDLLGELPEHLRGKVSIAVANLPQIPDRERSNTNVNDYYPLKDRRETLLHRFDQHGTGLLCNFLLAAIGVLSNDGSAILTMAGRCNIPEFNELFAYCGMSYHIASRIIIRQDPLTSIERFAEVEGTSAFRFTFYADGNGRRRISALDAMRAISQGKMVYHDLYVIVARPLQQGSGDYSICPI